MINVKYTIVLFVILFLFACTSVEGKNCSTDKECIKVAFKNCEKAYGTWEGNNGKIGVQITEKKGEKCTVLVNVTENDLSITNKNMTCEIPVNNSLNFSINSECRGELEDSFIE
ncbi:MAG: hypothetical protein Q7S22_02935 [Candidatus Micrarchaeota archaeon]|nr:hypothetical protein [Candidatus Micrarchaeota archaeon]